MLEINTTILVVEDDDGIRTLLATILRLAGYDVLTYSDGDEALNQLRENGRQVHLLLTDVHLGPHMDGMELAQGLRAFYPFMRVLYISGMENREEMLLEIDSGRAFFLSKPFKPSILTEKVAFILKGSMTVQRIDG